MTFPSGNYATSVARIVEKSTVVRASNENGKITAISVSTYLLSEEFCSQVSKQKIDINLLLSFILPGQDERMRDSDLETKAFLRGLKSTSTYEETQSVNSAIQSYGKR